jgi:hypothetical protein
MYAYVCVCVFVCVCIYIHTNTKKKHKTGGQEKRFIDGHTQNHVILCRQGVEEAEAKHAMWEKERMRRVDKLAADLAAFKQRVNQDGLNVDSCQREKDTLERDIRECQVVMRVH